MIVDDAALASAISACAKGEETALRRLYDAEAARMLGIANRLLRRVRDYVQVKAQGRIDAGLADKALKMLDVDAIGLDVMDRKVLDAVIHRFDGGPVGLDNVAAAIGEARRLYMQADVFARAAAIVDDQRRQALAALASCRLGRLREVL